MAAARTTHVSRTTARQWRPCAWPVREAVAAWLFLNNAHQGTYVREHAAAEHVGTVWLYWLPAYA